MAKDVKAETAAKTVEHIYGAPIPVEKWVGPNFLDEVADGKGEDDDDK